MSNNTRIHDINESKDKFGKTFEFDPTFHGPLEKRSCTDVLFLLIFIAFIIGWIIIASIGYVRGNPQQIIFPTDSYGGICGRGRHQDKPFLFFFDLFKCAKNLDKNIFDRCDTPQVCVSECPKQTFSTFDLTTFDSTYQKALICKYNVNATKENYKQLIREGKCAGMYLKSEPFGGRCIPSLLTINGQNLVDEKKFGDILRDENKTAIDLQKIKETNKAIVLLINAREIGSKIIQDLSETFEWILAGLAIAMVISFAWILLMQWFAQMMIWFSIIAVVVLNSFGVYYSINRYKNPDISEGTVNSSSNLETYNFRKDMSPELDSYLAERKTWLAFSIISGIVLIVLILILLFLRKRITLAIAIIKEASRAVWSVKSSLVFPIIPYIFQFMIICFWGSVAILITATARPKYVNSVTGKDCEPNLNSSLDWTSSENNCVFIKYYENNVIFIAQLYNLFGLLWGLFFVIGVGQVSLSGAFASYYWAFNKSKDVPYFAVFGGLFRCIRYHTGSVAIGSLLIATVRFIRIMIEYIDNKCKKYANNVITKAIVCCCKCFFWVLEAFMRYINKNAYIMIAIYGKGFCASASSAFYLILRNAARALVLDKVTDLLLIIGKLTVTSLVAVLSYYVFSHKIGFIEIPTLNYYWVPIAIITFGSYLISSSFFSVYQMAVDTLFLCFLEDCERNDGSTEKPYYMSKELMKVLGMKKKT